MPCRRWSRTMRRLPDKRVPGYYSAWPPVVRAANEAYGYDPARLPRIAPSPGAITRMEETFTWLAWIGGDDARIVWLRAEGVPWKPICWRIGVTRQTAWRRWAASLITIANRLSRQAKRKGSMGVSKSITANRRIRQRQHVA